MSPTGDLPTFGDVSDDDRARAAREVAAHRTLAEVLRWNASRGVPLADVVTVPQDEYTHDVVVPWQRGLQLVYDVT